MRRRGSRDACHAIQTILDATSLARGTLDAADHDRHTHRLVQEHHPKADINVYRCALTERWTIRLSKENHAVTPGLVAGSFLIMLSMVGGVPIPKNANKGEVTNEAPPEDLLTLVQTGGMVRRQDRRDTRQDCRHQEGAVGMDKRNCKQVRRQQRSSSPQTPNTGPPKS